MFPLWSTLPSGKSTLALGSNSVYQRSIQHTQQALPLLSTCFVVTCWPCEFWNATVKCSFALGSVPPICQVLFPLLELANDILSRDIITILEMWTELLPDSCAFHSSSCQVPPVGLGIVHHSKVCRGSSFERIGVADAVAILDSHSRRLVCVYLGGLK